jgi:hypothetical protein
VYALLQRVVVADLSYRYEKCREALGMAVSAFQDDPLADRDREWDGAAAEKRVRKWAGAEDEPRWARKPPGERD